MLRRRRPTAHWATPMACLVAGAALLAGCTVGSQPTPTTPELPSPTVSLGASTAAPSPSTPATTAAPATAESTPQPTASPTASPAADPQPGDPCDPSDGDPNCTDSLEAGTFTYVEGYADCVEQLGPESGLCVDLDGDGYAGYPDAG